MKLLIATTAAHLYVDPTNGMVVEPFRPTVVPNSQYIAVLMAANKVELIAKDLDDDATDEEFEKFFKESDNKADLAIDSFVSKYSTAPKVEKGPAPTATKTKA